MYLGRASLYIFHTKKILLKVSQKIETGTGMKEYITALNIINVRNLSKDYDKKSRKSALRCVQLLKIFQHAKYLKGNQHICHPLQ